MINKRIYIKFIKNMLFVIVIVRINIMTIYIIFILFLLNDMDLFTLNTQLTGIQ